jgi:hypothetical protein
VLGSIVQFTDLSPRSGRRAALAIPQLVARASASRFSRVPF